ncbi:L-lysine 6-transaminase [Candidatus Fermentibacteria bacterium]|nr:L-lysine 6-transaminase [Candidatus Fermentibacteria bacterium]
MKHITPNEVRPTISARMLADGFDIVLDLRRSKGSYIFDSISGKYYLDLFSFFASCPLGTNHPRIVEDEEFMRHLAEVAVNKPSNSDLYTEELAVFVDTFSKTALPDSHPHLFFISGGALAVENALKAAFDWKVRKNMAEGKEELGSQVIHFTDAFHGRTGYTLSLTNTFDPRKYMYFPKFGWPRIPRPETVFPLETNIRSIERSEAQALREIDRVLEQRGPDIACMIIEPIQGEGGDNHFRPEFLGELRDRADRNDFLLVFDEIQTGLGLTGEWWAWQSLGVEPDIFCFGKKTQVCGIACNRRIDEVKDNVFQESSRLNSTWGGNLVDMVRCTRYLEIMQEEDTLANVRERGKQLMAGLENISADHPQVSNVRGRGLMCAFTMPNQHLRDALIHEIMQEGAIILPCGGTSVRFRPPLNISGQEVDRGLEIMGSSLKEILE